MFEPSSIDRGLPHRGAAVVLLCVLLGACASAAERDPVCAKPPCARNQLITAETGGGGIAGALLEGDSVVVTMNDGKQYEFDVVAVDDEAVYCCRNFRTGTRKRFLFSEMKSARITDNAEFRRQREERQRFNNGF